MRNSEALLAALASLPGLEVVRVPNGTSVCRLNLREGNPARFRDRLRADGITLPEPDGTGFWLRINETRGFVPPPTSPPPSAPRPGLKGYFVVRARTG